MTEKTQKTYSCKVCDKERAKDSKICPHCGTEEQHWTKVLSRWFWILLIIGGIAYYEYQTSIIDKSIFKFVMFLENVEVDYDQYKEYQATKEAGEKTDKAVESKPPMAGIESGLSGYEDCILQSMQDVTSNVAAVEIQKACRNMFRKKVSKLRRLRDDIGKGLTKFGQWVGSGLGL